MLVCSAGVVAALGASSCGGSEWVRSRDSSRQYRHDGEQSGDWESNGQERGLGPATPYHPSNTEPTQLGEPYRNTYYDFPAEGTGAKTATVFDGNCKEIAKVTQGFHDAVCLQGSGRLSSGETISFARRDCECAALCPKSQHKICFDKLDPKAFPTGRGASGRPVTPLRSVAVDTELIPLGTPIRIQEFIGVALPGGGKHDGCFRADDRGSRVTGRHVDIFTGDPDETKVYNQLVPSNEGVTVEVDPDSCKYLRVDPAPTPSPTPPPAVPTAPAAPLPAASSGPGGGPSAGQK
jgi:3D (Asp-Asp-Asp) domain-containing protein